MDETERALMAEANAAGAPAQPPAPEDGLPPPATGDAVMEIEDDEEPEQMKIVRDYKRPEHRHACVTHMHPARPTWLPEQATSLSLKMRIFGSPGQLKRPGLLAMTGLPEQRRQRSLLPASLGTSETECFYSAWRTFMQLTSACQLSQLSLKRTGRQADCMLTWRTSVYTRGQ